MELIQQSIHIVRLFNTIKQDKNLCNNFIFQLKKWTQAFAHATTLIKS